MYPVNRPLDSVAYKSSGPITWYDEAENGDEVEEVKGVNA